MKKTQWKRVAGMVQTARASTQKTEESFPDFAAALRDARSCAAAGEPIPQTPITEEMMKDPVHGQFWRRMHQARERVRLLRKV